MIRESFNTNWFFCKEDGVNDKQATGPITLPHDAMLLEPRGPKVKNGHNTGFFPGGVYRYSKTFFAPEEWRNRNVTIEFEGVYHNSKVYINGQLAGGWPYGYTAFYIDADRFLHYGQDNTIEVVAHNEDEPNSRWYSGSGIYRNVNILVGRLIHIVPDGVRITTKAIQGQQAVVEVATTVVNNEKETRTVRIVTEFRGQDGQVDAPSETAATIRAGEITTIQQTVTFENPALWSPDHPNLYACSTRIADGESVIDKAQETFGIRTLALDATNGLRINGEEVKLRGGCIHHDNGVIGANTLEAAEDRRVRLMKASGFNAIRSAHNPISKTTLDACDRHGMLVMDEFSDAWFRPKLQYDYSILFAEWWERDIEAMVAKDYNHPCVVLYSIGNEIAETAIPEGVETSRKLADKVIALDSTRYVINCINGMFNVFSSSLQKQGKENRAEETGKTKVDETEKYNTATFNFILGVMKVFSRLILFLPAVDKGTRDAYATVDVAGYNYMAPRYERDGKRYPQRVICGSETLPPDIAKNWRLVKKLPHVIGDFAWTGWDYLGEAGISTWQYGGRQTLFKPYPYILADTPIIDITGHRQTQSYIHEIVWGLRKAPYLAVQPVNHAGEKLIKAGWRGTNAIASWSWDGCEGKSAVVKVYADADQVELFLNGKSLGKKPAGDRRDFKAVFKTTYQPGELTAVSYAKDRKEIGRTMLRTAGPALQLHAHSETAALKADGADLAYINIELADKDGIVKPLADRKVTVRVEGAGSLLGFGSAAPFTEERFTDEEHTTYYGRALAIVRAGLKAGTVQVTVSAEGCETQTLTIPVGKSVEVLN